MNRQFSHKAGAVAKVVFARLRFVSVFLAAGLIIGYWDNIRNHWDKWTRPAVAPNALAATAASEIEYYCAMHPNIVRAEPNNCPICGMPLIQRKKGEKVKLPEDVLARVQLSPQRITLAGIQTSMVEARPLVREIHAVGVLDYAEPKVAQISSRVGGRADELFVDYTGQQVNKGDKLYSLYSPELFAAQQDYELARQQVNSLPAGADEATKRSVSATYNAAMEKLVLWGVTREQLDEMDQEYDRSGTVPSHLEIRSPISGVVIRKDIFQGGYMQVGDRPFTIADLSTLWLQMKLYERDVPLVQIGQAVDVIVEALPGEVFKGTVTFKAFQLDPQTRTLDARVEVKNPEMRLLPGMFADARMAVPVGAVAAASQLAHHHVLTPQDAKAYAAALQPYLEAQVRLAADKAEGVAELLLEATTKLAPLADSPRVKQLAEAAQASEGQDLKAVRETFRQASIAMIELGKEVGLPEDAEAQVFRCPMVKADWLQKPGETANPYYGSEMLTCGSAVESLPKAETAIAANGNSAKASAPMVPAIPRSAVIEAGRSRIVYVESAPGVFDMRAVQLGPQAGDYYPVLQGLQNGEKVVTVGAFLVDSENRLNPSQTAEASDGEASNSNAAPAHQH
jgi:RND family efflux transporter MFP subunit